MRNIKFFLLMAILFLSKLTAMEEEKPTYQILKNHHIVDAFDLAHFIISELEEAEQKVDSYKLQKLLYICHRDFLYQYNKPLFSNRIEAWVYGPVIVDVFKQHQGLRWVTQGDIEGDKSNVDEELKDWIRNSIFNKKISEYGDKTYKDLDGNQLVAFIHEKDNAFRFVRRGFAPEEYSNVEITMQNIIDNKTCTEDKIREPIVIVKENGIILNYKNFIFNKISQQASMDCFIQMTKATQDKYQKPVIGFDFSLKKDIKQHIEKIIYNTLANGINIYYLNLAGTDIDSTTVISIFNRLKNGYFKFLDIVNTEAAKNVNDKQQNIIFIPFEYLGSIKEQNIFLEECVKFHEEYYKQNLWQGTWSN